MTGPVSKLIEAVRRGDAGAREQLFTAVYEELRRMASAKMAGWQPGVTLQPTALVHEAYLRLTGDGGQRWENRAHFFGAAAEAMRRILVDGYRRRQAAKRGGGQPTVPLGEEAAASEEAVDLLALDEALERLASFDVRKARVVECRYFLGLTVSETAEVLGVSTRTVEGDWELAKAWLRSQMNDSSESDAS